MNAVVIETITLTLDQNNISVDIINQVPPYLEEKYESIYCNNTYYFPITCNICETKYCSVQCFKPIICNECQEKIGSCCSIECSKCKTLIGMNCAYKDLVLDEIMYYCGVCHDIKEYADMYNNESDTNDIYDDEGYFESANNNNNKQ